MVAGSNPVALAKSKQKVPADQDCNAAPIVQPSEAVWPIADGSLAWEYAGHLVEIRVYQLFS